MYYYLCCLLVLLFFLSLLALCLAFLCLAFLAVLSSPWLSSFFDFVLITVCCGLSPLFPSLLDRLVSISIRNLGLFRLSHSHETLFRTCDS